jgi:hypothetical protein
MMTRDFKPQTVKFNNTTLLVAAKIGRRTTQMQAAMKFQTMPLLREAYPLFADNKCFEPNKFVLGLVAPVATKTHVAYSRSALGKSLEKVGGVHYLIDRTGELAEWLFPVPIDNYFLAQHKITLDSKNLLFVVEKYTVSGGPYEFVTHIPNPADIRVCYIPEKEWYGLHVLSALFGNFEKGKTSLGTTVRTHIADVKVGLVSVGDHAAHAGRASVMISCPLDEPLGILVHQNGKA